MHDELGHRISTDLDVDDWHDLQPVADIGGGRLQAALETVDSA